jgi:serine protease Do
MKKFAKILAAAVLFGTAAGTAFQGAEMIGKNVLVSQNETVKDSASAKLATTTVTTNQRTSTSDVSSISEQVLPSIVAIDVTAQTTTNTPFGAQTSEGTGSASGIIIAQKDNKMYIATNNHVVEGATSVTIIFNDESKVSATVKGTDSSTDLAVVEVDMSKLSDSTKKNIKIATIGDSKKTKVGEQAIAIGNALGYGTSVTVGYISAKDREIDAEDSASVKLIQTDAAINGGNSGGALLNASGGALVNSKGEVIAINSSKFASEEVEGMGFAIPMATAEPILEELMNQKEVAANNQAYLGITGRDVTSEYEQAYGIPQGIYISEVSAGSPAEKAGLQKGYIITKLNGTTVKTLSQLQEKLSKCEAGTQGKVTVKIASGSSYQEKTFSVTFGKKQN